jgi:Peptidase A4 family
MSARSLHPRVRNSMDTVDKYGSLRGGGRMTRPIRAAAMAGVASLAVGALALVAACGGGAAAASGPVSVSLSRTTLPPDGPVTRVSRGLEQADAFTVSDNWAGYVIQPGQDVDDVSGEWTVPTLDCQQTPNALDGVWAGIGGNGAGSGDLLQTGVADRCSNGAQLDQAWWELYPVNNPVNFGLLVSPGDEMESSVYLDQSGQWVTRIDNLTTGWSGWMFAGGTYGIEQDGSGSFTVEGSSSYISYAGGSTVEWVVEGPGLTKTGPSFLPLADFGTVQFSDLRAGLPSWSLSPDEGDEIVYDNQVVAEPGQPDGDGFSVSYTG